MINRTLFETWKDNKDILYYDKISKLFYFNQKNDNTYLITN